MAGGNAIPFYWDGQEDHLPSGWDGVLEQGMMDVQGGPSANALSALAVVIHPEYRGQGLSRLMVAEMKKIAKRNGIHHMVAPVRPSLKSTYPLIPIEEYINWKTKEGKPFDPWLRTHCSLGATIITIAPESMVIPATVEEWETWVGMELPATGSYIIQDGLVPLEVDREKNNGIYIEPNVWVEHHLD